ncbi:MAG: triose-phosphate isomerase family protein, partial [Peptostreptococcales bacterium]
SSLGGVNRIAPIQTWAKFIKDSIENGLSKENNLYSNLSFPVFFPEAHLISVASEKKENLPNSIEIGCQSVHAHDIEKDVNFGAMTTSLPASAAKELGCSWTIIGHSEERAKMLSLLKVATVDDSTAQKTINTYLNFQVKSAVKAGLKVLYCIGERSNEVSYTLDVISSQLSLGLTEVDSSKIVIAYEPIWAIGPGKTPPNSSKIREMALLIKNLYDAPVVYGGGLKKENAKEIGSISELDGGLIALTRFTEEIGFYPDEYLEIVKLYCEGGTL